MYFNFTNSGGAKSITLIGEETQVIPDSHPKFDALYDYLWGVEGEPDEDEVWDIVNKADRLISDFAKLSDNVEYRHGSILFDGDVVDNSLTRHILRMIDDGDENYTNFVAFLENLATNPSKISRLQLFRWLDGRDFTITDDGCFLGYKGINRDGLSVHGGGAYVDGVWVDGRVPNKKGTVITLPRSQVDNNRAVGCSTGLHVGTWDYASKFAQTTLLVKVNPRDVVSVPSDSNDQKLRVCRYVVVGDEQEEEVAETSWEPKEDDFFKEYDNGRSDW